jgi:hypothetical protein
MHDTWAAKQPAAYKKTDDGWNGKDYARQQILEAESAQAGRQGIVNSRYYV